jgi:hypothetical protein
MSPTTRMLLLMAWLGWHHGLMAGAVQDSLLPARRLRQEAPADAAADASSGLPIDAATRAVVTPSVVNTTVNCGGGAKAADSSSGGAGSADDGGGGGADDLPPFRIIGGVQALRDRFRFVCSLRDASGRLYCGCAIIAPGVAMTAAHCVNHTDPALNRCASSAVRKGASPCLFVAIGGSMLRAFSRGAHVAVASAT